LDQIESIEHYLRQAPFGNRTASDKLPGAPGVGATGAATLLQGYGSLEAALAPGRFPAQAENLRLYRSIATMNKKGSAA
jgi:5'-3' exonuclease